MEIVNKKLEELKPYENNPRFNDDAVQYVANSIKEFGFKVPIVIDKNGVIVAGHTRYKASMELGLKEVPCIVADDLTEKQIQAFRIADNKTNDAAGWNDDILGIELKDVMGDIDMTDFGFGDFELSMLTDDMDPDGYDDELISEYTQNSDAFLKAKRMIITYANDEEEEYLKKILNQSELKVSYTAKELMENL